MNGLREAGLKVTNSDALGCLDYERRRLKDPDSARLLESSVDASRKIVKIKYKAQNSFGAYVTTEVECVAHGSSNGSDELSRSINDNATELHRDGTKLDNELATVKAVNACLARRRDLMASGTTYARSAEAVMQEMPECRKYAVPHHDSVTFEATSSE